MKRIHLTILLLLFAAFSMAQKGMPVATMQKKAAEAYKSEKYEEATALYLKLNKQGESADVCYNLGNCYFRQNDIANSILWYERALLLDPSDEDVRANLMFVQTKTVDKIVSEEDIFFVRWYKSILISQSITTWIVCGMLFFALFMACALLYLFSQEIVMRKIGFFGSVIVLLLCLLVNSFAWSQHKMQTVRNRAVVMETAVTVKSTPSDNGTDLFLLHAGTTMSILDSSIPGWAQIRLSNDKEGWIPVSAIEKI